MSVLQQVPSIDKTVHNSSRGFLFSPQNQIKFTKYNINGDTVFQKPGRVNRLKLRQLPFQFSLQSERSSNTPRLSHVTLNYSPNIVYKIIDSDNGSNTQRSNIISDSLSRPDNRTPLISKNYAKVPTVFGNRRTMRIRKYESQEHREPIQLKTSGIGKIQGQRIKQEIHKAKKFRLEFFKLLNS